MTRSCAGEQSYRYHQQRQDRSNLPLIRNQFKSYFTFEMAKRLTLISFSLFKRLQYFQFFPAKKLTCHKSNIAAMPAA